MGILFVLSTVMVILFLSMVIFKHELASSRMDVSYALGCEGSFMGWF